MTICAADGRPLLHIWRMQTPRDIDIESREHFNDLLNVVHFTNFSTAYLHQLIFFQCL